MFFTILVLEKSKGWVLIPGEHQIKEDFLHSAYNYNFVRPSI